MISKFLQKERRVLTRKRTKMSNYLTHSSFVVDYVCCANKCNQKLTVLVPRIPVSTKCRQQTADRIQNIDCRLQSGYKMQTENLKSFFVWYVITCHLTTYRASRNRFSAISLHDYLRYFGIFLADFLMKINRNIISSLYIVFSLCARVGWCDVCTEFTNVIKVDVTIDSFSHGPYYHLFRAVCFYFVDKNTDQDQNCSFDLTYFRR